MIPLSTQHYAMLARNLLYTGLTRGRRLVGQRKALPIAVRNQGGGDGPGSASGSLSQ